MGSRTPKKAPPHRHLFRLIPLSDGTGYVAKCACGVLLKHVVENMEKKA